MLRAWPQMQSASRCVVRNLKHAPWLQPPFPAATEEDCAQGYELPTQRYVAFANRTNFAPTAPFTGRASLQCVKSRTCN